MRTGVGAGLEIDLEPSKLQKCAENPGKGHFYFLRETLVTKPWFKRDLNFRAKFKSEVGSFAAKVRTAMVVFGSLTSKLFG